MHMKLTFKTAIYLPLILLLGTLFYTILLFILLLAYFVGIILLPTKLYRYLKQLEDYRRIQK